MSGHARNRPCQLFTSEVTTLLRTRPCGVRRTSMAAGSPWVAAATVRRGGPGAVAGCGWRVGGPESSAAGQRYEHRRFDTNVALVSSDETKATFVSARAAAGPGSAAARGWGARARCVVRRGRGGGGLGGGGGRSMPVSVGNGVATTLNRRERVRFRPRGGRFGLLRTDRGRTSRH
jgi:hypothetical protein